MTGLRTFYVGAVEGSRVGLHALIEAGLAPDLVVTLPPSAAARHSDFADIGALARERGIPVHETTRINDGATLDALRELQPDLGLVIGWSQICGPAFRAVPRLGTIGFHPSPLPRLRGRAVIPWTIILGEQRSGSSLFWIDEGTDTGPIVLQERFELDLRETAATLYARHTDALARMLPRAVRLAAEGRAPAQAQDHAAASICARRRPEDGELDWSRSADEIDRLVRALGGPYPPAHTWTARGRLNILAAEPVRDEPRFIGFPGQVQARTDGAFTVLCGDGSALLITAWDGERPAMHERLGAPRPNGSVMPNRAWTDPVRTLEKASHA